MSAAGTSEDQVFARVDLSGVTTLLLDADDCLFGSEAPAFVACAGVINRVMEEIGSPRRYDAEELRLAATGSNFRAMATRLSEGALAPEDLERWVAEEKRAVTEHLSSELSADEEVRRPLERLARRYRLAVVSSSALSRLDACFVATGLEELLPAGRRFSAEDSLETPVSKPDPAVYRFAGEQLGIRPHEGLAVEDSPTGTRSAVGAGFATVGNVGFVRPEEREERVEQLRAAGAFAVVSSWAGVERLLGR